MTAEKEASQPQKYLVETQIFGYNEFDDVDCVLHPSPIVVEAGSADEAAKLGQQVVTQKERKEWDERKNYNSFYVQVTRVTNWDGETKVFHQRERLAYTGFTVPEE